MISGRNCPSSRLSHSERTSLTIKSGSSKVPNVWLLNEKKNFFLHSVLGSSTTARYSLLLILTVHFVINACLAYLLEVDIGKIFPIA